jgi:hypothetical protein
MGKEERGSVRVPAPRLPPMNEMMTSALFHRPPRRKGIASVRGNPPASHLCRSVTRQPRKCTRNSSNSFPSTDPAAQFERGV